MLAKHLLLSSVFRPKHWAKWGLNCKLCTFLPVDNTLVIRKKNRFLPWFHVLLDMLKEFLLLKAAIMNPSR